MLAIHSLFLQATSDHTFVVISIAEQYVHALNSVHVIT